LPDTVPTLPPADKLLLTQTQVSDDPAPRSDYECRALGLGQTFLHASYHSHKYEGQTSPIQQTVPHTPSPTRCPGSNSEILAPSFLGYAQERTSLGMPPEIRSKKYSLDQKRWY